MERYRALIEEVDRLAERLSNRYRDHLACRAGCSSCCQCNLTIFQVEAAAVSEAICTLTDGTRRRILRQARETEQKEGRGEYVACPMLLDDLCAIYAARPLICRTQGLPLLYELEDGTKEVDFCPLNFTAPGATDCLEENHLVPLDQANLELALANSSYCRSIGLDDERSGARTKMSTLAAAGTRRNE